MKKTRLESPPPRAAEASRLPSLRAAARDDLAAINALIERAVGTWDLSPRVKRASLPLYRYHAVDFEFLSIRVALDDDGQIVGVSAWEPADAGEAPGGAAAALLHGIYVDPANMRRGIGSRLLAGVVDAVRGARLDGVLVRAQADAGGFFEARGFARLAAADPARDYAYRYWLELCAAGPVSAG